jgi:DnaK suppressor protein
MSTRKLDRRTRRELEQFLRDELDRVRGSLQALTHERRTAEMPSPTDMTVHAAETLHTEIQVALVDRRAEQANQIQDALQRLSQGHYGFCQDCDAFVGLKRLRALPFAQRCLECQGEAERRGRQERPGTARARAGELEAA